MELAKAEGPIARLIGRAGTLKIDWVLAALFVAAFAISLIGIDWANPEIWSADQMARRNLFADPERPFYPGNLLKPTFMPYFHLIASAGPWEVIEKVFGVPEPIARAASLAWSQIINLCFFLGAVLMTYLIAAPAFGKMAARAVAALYLVAAGLQGDIQGLTVDITLLFWCTTVVFFGVRTMERPSWANYIGIGVSVGLAMGTKYNGVILGIGLPIAHLLAHLPARTEIAAMSPSKWGRFLLRLAMDPKAWAALALIPIVFLLSTPYVLIEFQSFVGDWNYNSVLTPIYEGQSGNNSYWPFLASGVDMFGLPATLLMAASAIYAVVLIARRKVSPAGVKVLALCAGIFVVYFLLIGSYPRFLPRFALPVYGLGFIFVACALSQLPVKLWSPVVAAIVVYGAVCSILTGLRVYEDPRRQFQAWARVHLDDPSITAERTPYAPKWDRMALKAKQIDLPHIAGRIDLLKSRLQDRPDVLKRLIEIEGQAEAQMPLYTRETLEARAPDYFVTHSFYYGRFTDLAHGDGYPSMKRFFEELLAGSYNYGVVFQECAKPAPNWSFPRDDGYANCMVALARKSAVN